MICSWASRVPPKPFLFFLMKFPLWIHFAYIGDSPSPKLHQMMLLFPVFAGIPPSKLQGYIFPQILPPETNTKATENRPFTLKERRIHPISG